MNLPQASVDVEQTEILAAKVEVWDRLLFLAVMVTLFLLCCFPLIDTDFWWHLRTGELIWQNREIPRFDWYTYKDADRPWIDLHWGFQLLIAGLYHLGGSDLIILFKAAAYTLTAAIGWKTVGSHLPSSLKGVLWICPVVLLAGRAFERPEIMTMVFLSCVLWIVHRVDERPRLIWWLVPLQLVWINFHALSAVGLVVGWSLVAARLVEKLWPDLQRFRLRPDGSQSAQIPLKTLIMAMTAATLIGFINPYFQEGVIFPEVLLRKFMSDKELYKTIGEFAPPMQFIDRHGLTNVSPIALVILSIMSVFSFLPPLVYRRFSTFRFFLLLGFGWLGWTAVRNQNLFGLVAIVITCGNLDDAWCSWTTSAKGNVALVPASSWSQLWLSRGVVALFCVWMFFVVNGEWGQAKWTDGNRKFGLGETQNWYAHDAMIFAGREGLPKYAYVSHGLAPVYIYHNGPEHKVFTDPRLEVASLKTYQDFTVVAEQMAKGDPAWMETVRGPDGRLPVLVLHLGLQRDYPAILGIAKYFSNRWRLVYVDKISCVFVEEQLAKELKLPAPG